MVSVLSQSWNLGPNLEIHQLDKNIITYTFKDMRERNRILETGTWAIKGAILNLKPWSLNLPLGEVDFSICHFWVQIHNILPNRMNIDNITRIGNFIGQFCNLEDAPQLHRACKFVWVRAAVDTRYALIPGSYITREDDSKLWLQFKYEKLPDFCYHCGKLDHAEAACPEERTPTSQSPLSEGRYGSWLRAQATGKTMPPSNWPATSPSKAREN